MKDQSDVTINEIDDMNRALCEALGIDIDKEQIRKVTLTITAMEPPKLTVEKFTDEHGLKSIVEVISTLSRK